LLPLFFFFSAFCVLSVDELAKCTLANTASFASLLPLSISSFKAATFAKYLAACVRRLLAMLNPHKEKIKGAALAMPEETRRSPWAMVLSEQ
jgi:hypothetical protein